MERRRNDCIVKGFMIIAITIGIYLGMKYLFPLIFPFVIAFFVVSVTFPYVQTMEKKTHINKCIIVSSMLLLILIPFIGLTLYLVMQLVQYVTCHLRDFAKIQDHVYLFVHNGCNSLECKLGMKADVMEHFVLNKIDICMDSMRKNATLLFMGKSMKCVNQILVILASVVITFVAILLLTKDYEKIRERLDEISCCREFFEGIKKSVHILWVFIRAQIIIMLVIAMISGFGFLVLGMKNAVLLAIITCVLDVLPFIGTGVVMLPLALWSLIQYKFLHMIVYIILYIACALAREMLEPKLIGEKLGIYPIGILFSIYIGIKLYGFGGLLLGPVMMFAILESVKKIYGKENSNNSRNKR